MPLPSLVPTDAEFSEIPDSRCRYLAWDSQFFARRIGSVKDSRLSGGAVTDIEDWCKAYRIDCLYFLADFLDAETIRLAEDHGFRLVDMRLTLGRVLPASLPEPRLVSGNIRPSLAQDITVLKSIASISHRDSRFYFDANFPRDRCDALYETWIEKSCDGYADLVLVLELNGRPAGYVSCHLGPENSGNIGLVGLAPEARGKGMASELVQAALRWFSSKSVRAVTVITQGRNIAAQRLYQRNGFTTQSVQLWYHRWFSYQRCYGNEFV